MSSLPMEGAKWAAGSGIGTMPSQAVPPVQGGSAPLNTTGVAGPAPTLPGSGITWDKAMAAINKYAPAASLGLNILGQAKAKSYQSQLDKIAQPAQEVGSQLLAKFQSGQLSAADQFAIQQWAQQQRAAVQQYYQKAGLSDSSMATQALAQVDQQAEQMRQQAIQAELQQGLAALGVASPTLRAGVNAGMQSDLALMQGTSQFLQELARMNTGATPTGTPG